MNADARVYRIYSVFKENPKINVLSCLMTFGPAGLMALLGCSILASRVGIWISSGNLWGPSFNYLMIDLVFSILLILASVPYLSTGYLLLKSHYAGIILGSMLGIIQLTVFFLGRHGGILVLIAGSLCLVAVFLGYFGRRGMPARHRDSATVLESVVKNVLRVCGLLCTAILIGMTVYIGARGARWITWDFLTTGSWNWDNANRVASGLNVQMGGIRDFVIGSLLLVSLSELIAIPLGLGAAIFLSEYAPDNKVTGIIRFFIETLAGIPSVVIGLVGFGFFVITLGMNRSWLAGSLSLAFMILPWNVTVTEEVMKAVPNDYREASYALGATKWQTTRRVVLEAALPGTVTGILLGLGGAIGETVVVLLTAGDYGMAIGLPKTIALTGEAIPSLPVWIYGAFRLLNSGYATGQGVWEAQNISLAGAFVLLLVFLGISITSLVLRNRYLKKLSGR